jgi:serine/threonine protein phosphatase PrpC
VVCVREGDNLIVANVGDSRCVLGRRVVGAGSNPGGSGRELPPFASFGSRTGTGGFERYNARRGGSTGPLDKNGAKTKAYSYVAVDLSVDHKPDRPDEASRIARAGGIVEPARGLHGYAGPARVWRRIPRAGGLAVSRAFGDSQLHSAGVVAIPEIKTLGVTPNDAFVVLASDGVWDHVSSAEAVRIVGECVNEGEHLAGAVTHRAVTHRAGDDDVWARAAAAVARRATEGWRRSLGGVYRDDITCVVVPILH